MNSLTVGQDGMNPPLWAILISNTPSKHTLGQDLLFVTAPEVRLLANDFERVGLCPLTLSHCGVDSFLWAPTEIVIFRYVFNFSKRQGKYE